MAKKKKSKVDLTLGPNATYSFGNGMLGVPGPVSPYSQEAADQLAGPFNPNAPDIPNPVGSFSAPAPVSAPTYGPFPAGTGTTENKYASAAPISTTMAPKPVSSQSYRIGSAAVGGLAAGQEVQPTTDSTGAVVQAVEAGAQGAAMGAAVGGLPGAAVGGALGLVSGGLNAYLGLQAAREQRRKSERINAQIAEKEQERYDQNRADVQEQVKYNRKQAALQSQWNAYMMAGTKFNEILANDEHARQIFTSEAR